MNTILEDTLAAQLSSQIFFNEEVTIRIPDQEDIVISGFFDKVDNAGDDFGNISRLTTSHRFITATELNHIQGMMLITRDLHETVVKQIQRDKNGMTVIWLL